MARIRIKEKLNIGNPNLNNVLDAFCTLEPNLVSPHFYDSKKVSIDFSQSDNHTTLVISTEGGKYSMDLQVARGKNSPITFSSVTENGFYSKVFNSTSTSEKELIARQIIDMVSGILAQPTLV